MGEFVGCIEGIGEAARALDFPIVSGNVSLYNETMGAGIPPTPAIGGVGARRRRGEGGEPRLQGGGRGHSAGRRRAGMARPLRLARDDRGPRGGRAAAGRPRRRAAQRRIRRVAHSGGKVSAVHDLSDGGLAVALAEMAMAGGIGASVEADGARATRSSSARIRAATS